MQLEILSPAGSRESLEAAVRAGADAVYLGGKAFGARANAKNFDSSELADAVEYCHQRGVRVHVTVNTIIKERELPQAIEFVRYLCSLPVDAVLVQDMGLLAALRRIAPELPLHASTQLSLHTPAGVRLMEELGMSRVVLGRELSLNEIKEIRAGTSIELEAFVHGALCMCLSGQCYLSAMLGGRSGNRGQCAQPCRLPFSGQEDRERYDLSLRDLSFINSIQLLHDAGVCSAKIEGRMKRPEYVAAATAACRLAADGQPVPQELTERLEAVFSRSGFTNGYLTGRLGPGMFGTRRKEDVTAATEKVLGELRALYRSERRSVPVKLVLSADSNQATLTAQDMHGHASAASAVLADSPPLGRERMLQQLKKTGGTPFFPEDISVPETIPGLAVSALNGLRREALEGLMAQRAKKQPIPCGKYHQLPPFPIRCGKPRLRAVFRSVEQICPEAMDCAELALPIETPQEELDALRARYPGQLMLDIPRGMFGQERQLKGLIEARMTAGYMDFICGNLGALQLCRELGGNAHGSFGLNIANSQALEELSRLGLRSAELSLELSGSELRDINGPIPHGVTVYGRQALMLTRNCPLANSRGCRGCAPGHSGELRDRKGMRFPVMCRSLTKKRGTLGAELLNSVPLWLGDLELPEMDFMVITFTVENSVECGETFRALRDKKALPRAFTRGLFRRGVE